MISLDGKYDLLVYGGKWFTDSHKQSPIVPSSIPGIRTS